MLMESTCQKFRKGTMGKAFCAPHVENLKAESDLMARGWNQLKSYSLTCLVPGLGGLKDEKCQPKGLPVSCPHDWLSHCKVPSR